ncbi:conserved membrane hypothetical protein [Frankia canadensis]|uniref:DUF6542 domain-containing protein n=1 Tax=Frankia canadensis TaxID=1836972 RepID=A0A2I2KLZ0_9ACTN|nr:DUF6542 domain-containing protein [Frankia canadensis]SNQ46680.1 conserved membrane hypothetical protein [Frankia canadensis]SOU53970.1 conserved membrane hypothetical protein [Frankia canadensis]
MHRPDALEIRERYLAFVSVPPHRQSAGPQGRSARADRFDDPYVRGSRGRSSAPPPTLFTGSRRGLTALGTALVVLVIGGLGALIDSVAFGSLSYGFGVLFIGGCVLVAVRVHTDDLIGVVIMPPLVYALITIGVGYLDPSTGDGSSGLKNKALDIGSEMILHAPILLAAFLLVTAIALFRGRRAQIARRERARALAQSAGDRRRRPDL